VLGIDPLSGGHRLARQTAFSPRRTCLAGPQAHHVDLATATVVRSAILAPSPDAFRERQPVAAQPEGSTAQSCSVNHPACASRGASLYVEP